VNCFKKTVLLTFFTGPLWAPDPRPFFLASLDKKYIISQLNYFEPEDGGSTYLRNYSNTAHIHKFQRPKNRMNISLEP
jgi:hypothetical protein